MGRGTTVLEVLLYTIQGWKLRPPGHAMEKLTLNSTLIDTLWRDNQDLVDQFLNNDFLKLQAEGTTENTISSYQYYTVQDYYYLVDYVQYKALRMTTFSESFPTELLSVLAEETASMQGDVDYAWSFRNDTLATTLSVPLDVVDAGRRGVAQLAYSDWLQKNLDLGWFTLHVMAIPCIYGWAKLAEHLDSSNTTRKDTVFYKTWIEPNLDPSYGNALMGADKAGDFLEANRDVYYSADANQTWTSVFRQALQFEISLFNSAIGTSLEDLA
ncbi:hypothetical protein BFW01_g370 [Lasiodiplodia theobromae]|uniref:Thiaminase-2/PQQC domain-containing protein n=1 Tax=Lasiodiplodia theobromae TaxID=45133 RepID=A0A8H7MB88_9PEZI|nr:hypothetical protein BFW01_g370 [Lasiodiplodia theobromae]